MKKYFLGLLVLSSVSYIEARGEEEDPLLQQDAVAQQHDDVATAQKEEERKQAEEAAQRARERGRQGEDGSSVVQQGQRGSRQLGKRTSTSTSTAPVNDSAAQALVGQRDNSTGELVVDMPVELKSLSKEEQKQAKKNRDAVAKSFNKIETAIQKGKDTSNFIDTFFNEISRCNFVNGRLPEEIRTLVVDKLKTLQKSSVSKEVKEYTKIVIKALEERSTSDRAILQGGVKQLHDVSALLREVRLPIRYDRSKPLSEQGIYKKAKELEAKVSEFTGTKYSGPVKEILDSLQVEFWKSKGITLNNGTFNPADAPIILSKMIEDPTFLQDPLVATFVQQHVTELFQAPTKVTADYTYNDVRDGGATQRTTGIEGKSWKEINEELKAEESSEQDQSDYIYKTLNRSDAAQRYGEALLARFLKTAVEELKNAVLEDFDTQFRKIATLQLNLVSKIREFLEKDVQNVDQFISTNSTDFNQLKELSPRDYDAAVQNFRTSLL